MILYYERANLKSWSCSYVFVSRLKLRNAKQNEAHRSNVNMLLHFNPPPPLKRDAVSLVLHLLGRRTVQYF